MYLDSGGTEKDGATMSLDRKLSTNGGNLLRGRTNDDVGIHIKIQRWIDKLGAKSSDTIDNVKAKILECLRGDRKIVTKRSRYTTIGIPCDSRANIVNFTNKINEILKNQLEPK